jgi:hypothetical protein
MATTTERLQALYNTTLTKLEEAMAAAGPKYTVPGGATLDRMEYIRELRAELVELAKIPGVAPEQNPTFQFEEYL